jgi:DNA-binding TFAR19-related protein (PDSD5 family)
MGLDDVLWDTSALIRLWYFSLGATALLDFSACVAERYVSDDDDLLGVSSSGSTEMRSLIQDLRDHRSTFNILFSLLWFLDAFISASRCRLAASRQRDRRRLLRMKEGFEVEEDDDWLRQDQKDYYYAIGWQLLLLPVGFYVFCYHCYRRMSDPGAAVEKIRIVHHTEEEDIPDEVEAFSDQTSICLGLAVVRYLVIEFSTRTGHRIEKFGRARARSFAIHMIFRALRHPFRFTRRIRKFLRAVRWGKYLAPLVGTFNKLKGNVSDLAKKYRQQQDAKKARALRQKLWDELTSEELRNYCATLIQKTWRARLARKRVRAMQILRCEKETLAAVKFQALFRGSLARARVRLKQKQEALLQLQQQEAESRKKGDKEEMKAVQRRRMYMLQHELNDTAKDMLNRKMLLRPNTTFAVTWKIMFVVAVIFEISQLAFKPILSKYKDEKTGKPWDIETIMDHALIPKPIAEWPQCAVEEPKRRRFPGARLIARFRPPKPVKQKPLPWFCRPFFVAIQGTYIRAANFCIHQFLVIVGIICFLDVFVTFFTGELNSETGALEPKPFVARWILPGLVLQLLVNPQMETVSEYVWEGMASLLAFGPVRVFRWAAALFYPACVQLIRWTTMYWQAYASSQNRRHVWSDHKGNIAHGDWHQERISL